MAENNIKGIKLSKLEEALEIRDKDYFPLVQDGKTKRIRGELLKRIEVDLSNYYNKQEVDEALDKIKLLTTGVKFNISESDFIATRSITLYKAILNHNLNAPIEGFSITFYDLDNTVSSLDYKIVDNNNIEIFSDLPVNILVTIKQAINVEAHNHDDLYSKLNHTHDEIENHNHDDLYSKLNHTHSEIADHNHDEAYANKVHRHDASEIDNLVIPEVDLSNYYNKQETYNKQEVDKAISSKGFSTEWGNTDSNTSQDTIILFEYTIRHSSSSTRIIKYNNKLIYMVETRNGYGNLNILDLETKKVISVGNNRPAGGCAIGMIGNEVFIIGGAYAPGHGYTWYTSNTVTKYNLETKETTTLAGYPKNIENTTAVVHGGELYVLGGKDYVYNSGTYYWNDLYKYDRVNNKWIALAKMNKTGCFNTFSYKQFIYAFEGTNINKYNVLTDTWSSVGSFPQGVESAAINSSVQVGQYIYIFGEKLDADNNAKVYVYDIETNTFDKDTVRYPYKEARSSSPTLVDDKILLMIYRNSKLSAYYYTPIGSIINERINVSNVKGSTKDLNRFSGVPGQLIVNTDDNSIHVMDGTTKGGHKIGGQVDVSELTNEINKMKEEILALKAIINNITFEEA